MEAKGSKLNGGACQRTKDESDFIIKVGEKSFPVHQNVLIAASDYFRAMLSHDTKERQEGIVDMKKVEPDAVKLCIEFMYTGATTVTIRTVPDLLPAVDILQLNALSEKCVEVLKKNLKAENCIFVLKLAITHSFTNLEEKALKLFRENYYFEELGDFEVLNKEGLVKRIFDFLLRNELSWEVIINWIKLNVEERSKDILELVKLLDWESSPSAELLEKLWSEPIFTDSQECKKFLFRHLFMDYEKLGQILTVENCFIIERMSLEFEFLSKQAMDAIGTFMKANLILISKKEEFKYLSEKLVLSLFEDRTIDCLCDEALKWNAMISWVKVDAEREMILSRLAKTIRFDLLSEYFLSEKIKHDQFFSESLECHKVFFDCMLKPKNAFKELYVAFLYPDGNIFALDMLDKSWCQIPVVTEKKTFNRMFSMHGRLCLIEDDKLSYLMSDGKRWMSRSSLNHAPGANSQIVISGGSLFIVEKERTALYKTRTNKWIENIPGCGLNGGFIAETGNTDLFVWNFSSETSCLQYSNWQWTATGKTRLINSNASSAFHRGIIFRVGVYNNPARLYNKVCCLTDKWEFRNDLPVALSSQSWLFSSGEKLLLFVSGVLYIYDDACDSWVTFMKIPNYNSVCFGFKQYREPVSVCCFTGNLSSLPKIN